MAKKSESSKSGKKKAAKPAQSGSPLIDTDLAAQNAAKLVAAHLTKQPVKEPKQESSLFKQLKQSVSKPHSQIVSNMLEQNATSSQKQSHEFLQQSAHSQTNTGFNKINVPRRTGG